MATPLQSASIAAPGFFGLNTQESGITLESGFALQAQNCVIDKFGRLGARKGWQYAAQTDPAATVNLKGMHRFVDVTAVERFGCWSDDTFYIKTGATLVEVPYTGTQTISEGNWQAVTLNDRAFLFQAGYEPLYFDIPTQTIRDMSQAESTATVTITSSSTTATVTHTSHGFSDGNEVTISGANETEYNGTFTITVTSVDEYEYTLNNSTSSPATGTITVSWYHDTPPQANVALSAYGRLWVASTSSDKTTVYWSDLLDGTDWGSGTSGSLDISSILVYGNDEITGLGAHNGALIIFCKQNIIILGDSPADGVSTQSGGNYNLDPTALQLVEVISGVGCIARDSIQNTGTDIVFLSESGLRSLGRVIQEKSQPMRDLSKNVRDDIVQLIEGENKANIKSTYSESNAFYLLSFPSTQSVYCFDMRAPLEDGSARVTIWDNMGFTDWLGFDGEIYMTDTNGLARYFGYLDNASPYRMVYFTNYFDLGSPSVTKILKRLAVTVIGGTNQNFFVKAGFDYEDQYYSNSLTLEGGTVYEYGTVDYGVAGTTAVSQGADTVTDGEGNHVTIDFSLTSSDAYSIPLTVWLDADTFYYNEDDGSRTETTVYTRQSDYTAEYSGGTLVDTLRIPGRGSGSVMQLGFEADLQGSALSIQKIDVYVKQGRTL